MGRDLKSASNKISIGNIYFELSERHDLNMDIISFENLFAERVIF
jgi:hypothetical protein